MSVQEELQKLEPDAIIELYELDLRPFDGPQLFFHPGLNEKLLPVVWGGQEYAPWPLETTGFQVSGKAQQGRPTLTVANISGGLTGLVREYQDLVGAKIIRRRTFKKFLDAVNFASGENPMADASEAAHLSLEEFIVERKMAENDLQLGFELVTPLDVANQRIPARIITKDTCDWAYRSESCGYVGGPVADLQDQPTDDPDKDRCSRRLSGCRLRFGEHSELPFGGAPATKVLT